MESGLLKNLNRKKCLCITVHYHIRSCETKVLPMNRIVSSKHYCPFEMILHPRNSCDFLLNNVEPYESILSYHPVRTQKL